MTYKQAFDKITEAYIKGEIKPWQPEFCFCGTLCNSDISWHGATMSRRIHNYHNDFAGYVSTDFARMENALLTSLYDRGVYMGFEDDPGYESALFAGMSAALDVLKQIHIERGEIINEVSEFTQRLTALNTNKKD